MTKLECKDPALSRDVPSPKVEVETRDEWLTETDQPDNTEDNIREAILLNVCESKDESPSKDKMNETTMSENVKSEDACEAKSLTEEN